MPKKLSGTKTEENLRHAFSVETQAHMKYSYYQTQAVKDGYHNLSLVFMQTANNEQAHAKIWFKLLHEDKIPETAVNLADSMSGEHSEWSEMYNEFADVADSEGFTNIAELFRGVGVIERQHEQHFTQSLNDLKNGKVSTKDNIVTWKCGNCGHIHSGNSAPEMCPVCSHPVGWFIDMSSGDL